MIAGTTAFQLQSSNFLITIQKNIAVGTANVKTIGLQSKNTISLRTMIRAAKI
ncbi:Uncharacterised protein [Segatella copri]|nr:Uncharacterised protein [Segatella copri]